MSARKGLAKGCWEWDHIWKLLITKNLAPEKGHRSCSGCEQWGYGWGAAACPVPCLWVRLSAGDSTELSLCAVVASAALYPSC